MLVNKNYMQTLMRYQEFKKQQMQMTQFIIILFLNIKKMISMVC